MFIPPRRFLLFIASLLLAGGITLVILGAGDGEKTLLVVGGICIVVSVIALARVSISEI